MASCHGPLTTGGCAESSKVLDQDSQCLQGLPGDSAQCRIMSRMRGPWVGTHGGQPGGLPEGSRWSYSYVPTGHRKTGSQRRAPRRVCQNRPQRKTFRIARRGSETSLAPPAGVQDISCAVTRRSPPPEPPVTSGYPLTTLRVDGSRLRPRSRSLSAYLCSAVRLLPYPQPFAQEPLGHN